jgi:branched-chain amino acid transport system permease protein
VNTASSDRLKPLKLSTGLALLAVLALLITGIYLPSLISVPYFMHLIILALIGVVMAQGQNLIQGFTGYVSITQAGFMGLGAYFSTLLTLHTGCSAWLTLALAPIFTAGFAVLVGYPALRVKGHYFAIVTLAYNLVIFTVLLSFSSLTGGEAGLSNIARPAQFQLLGMVIDFEGKSSPNYFRLVLLIASLATLGCGLVLHSRIGRVLLAIRQNEALTESLGVSIVRYKLLAFVISAAYAGMAGGLYAHYIGFLNPDPFGVDQSLNTILAVILGGSGTLSGPVVGAFAVTFLPEYLRIADSYRLVTYGFILIMTTIFLPRGVVPVIGKLGGLLAKSK